MQLPIIAFSAFGDSPVWLRQREGKLIAGVLWSRETDSRVCEMSCLARLALTSGDRSTEEGDWGNLLLAGDDGDAGDAPDENGDRLGVAWGWKME